VTISLRSRTKVKIVLNISMPASLPDFLFNFALHI
jgi:hypothetical protein